MSSKRIPAALAAPVLVASLAVVVPYLVALSLPPDGTASTGFLLNPIDGFSYLAKMRQGYAGGWSFQLPYAYEPGSGALIFTYYLGLGHLASSLGLSLLATYQGARALAAVAMFTTLGCLAFWLHEDRSAGRYSLAWLALGSGLGWLGTVAGVLGSDLLIPESIPFTAAYANAHFPGALALMVLAIAAVTAGFRPRLRLTAVLACGVGLSIILPFAAISVAVVLAAWWIWELVLARQNGTAWAAALWSDRTAVLAAFALGSMPFLVYDFLLTETHPALSVWHAQNLTPSPGIASYLIGFGPLLLLAGIAVVRDRKGYGPRRRLLVVWAVSSLLLLYAPFGLQRRLTLGLFVPLALLAGDVYGSWVKKGSGRRTILAIGLLALTIPSNLLVVGAGLAQVRSGEDSVLYMNGERTAYRWVEENVEAGALILAAPLTGNRLPAFADVRVLYGHPFETPNATEMRAVVEGLFASGAPEQASLRALDKYGVDFVFYGPHERNLGDPNWLRGLEIVFQAGDVTIYKAS